MHQALSEEGIEKQYFAAHEFLPKQQILFSLDAVEKMTLLAKLELGKVYREAENAGTVKNSQKRK